MTAKLEVYFRVTEEAGKHELGIHWPNYNVTGEQPLWEGKEQRGTIRHQEATLDVSEVKVGHEEGNITISPNMNIAKRYARILLDKETARKLANDILAEVNKSEGNPKYTVEKIAEWST
jgi:hypothetical protein